MQSGQPPPWQWTPRTGLVVSGTLGCLLEPHIEILQSPGIHSIGALASGVADTNLRSQGSANYVPVHA
jgi:hypothetical protein